MGHRDEALALVRRAVQAWSQGDSTTSRVDDRHLGLCEFLLDFGEPLEALDFAERLCRAVEQMPQGRTESRLLRIAGYFIGRSLLDLGRCEEARAHVTACLEALPAPPPGRESGFRQRLERLLGEILLRQMSIIKA
ncbi:hypothetical protein KEG38_09215 [Polyangium jinanense]|nr:hypothetical protein [Polyangium jinanense]MDC3954024.1 hypothetical protein [Polyangium jinanense]